MSLFDTLTRFARDLRTRRMEARTRNYINGLPRDIQKDIGWPDAYRPSRQTGRGRSG